MEPKNPCIDGNRSIFDYSYTKHIYCHLAVFFLETRYVPFLIPFTILIGFVVDYIPVKMIGNRRKGGSLPRKKGQKRAHVMRRGHDLPIFREKWPTELSRKHCHAPAKENTYLQHGSCCKD